MEDLRHKINKVKSVEDLYMGCNYRLADHCNKGVGFFVTGRDLGDSESREFVLTPERMTFILKYNLIEHIEGMPLTRDVMKDIGFEHRDDYYWYIKDTWYRFHYHSKGLVSYQPKGGKVVTAFFNKVHELQIFKKCLLKPYTWF